MRIAILGTRGIPARYGGFETFAEELSARLVERGHSVTVFCEVSAATSSESVRGVQVRHIAAPELGPASTIIFDLACLWNARRDFDVVYMLGYASSAFCWIPRLFGSEVWINMDGLEWARAKWGRVARLYLRLSEMIATKTANRMIADAAAIKKYLSQRYPKSAVCDVIPYGCEIAENEPDSSWFYKIGLKRGEYYLLVCRFEPENHVREIIEGYCRSSSHRPLVLVGHDKAPTEYVREMVQTVDPRIRFIGPVYDKTMLLALRYYAAAYFHGHSVGGTNPSLLEAMGCGNLVVAHENIFNREVLGPNALFFGDSDDFRRAVESIEKKTIPVEEMRAAVLKRAQEFYTWDRITAAYCELLESARLGKASVINFAPALNNDNPINLL